MSEKPDTSTGPVNGSSQYGDDLNGATRAKPEAPHEVDQPAAKGWKFWMVFPPLCIATLLVALESTVTSTSLPMITASLNSGDNYVWFLNGFLLTS